MEDVVSIDEYCICYVTGSGIVRMDMSTHELTELWGHSQFIAAEELKLCAA